MNAVADAETRSRQHRHAVRFFWAWLLCATLVSLAGNITHAWLTASPPTRWLAAAVAVARLMVWRRVRWSRFIGLPGVR